MSRPRLLMRAAVTAALVGSALAVPLSAQATTTGHSGTGRIGLAYSGGRVWIGWTGTTGTTGAKGLNLGWSTDEGKTITKTTDGEYAPQGEGPALSGDDTGVYMAWPAGNHGNQLTAVYTVAGNWVCRTAFAGVVTPHSPTMAADPQSHRWIAWDDPTGHINIAQLDSDACGTPGGQMQLVNRTVLSATSAFGPTLDYDNNTEGSNLGVMLSWVDSSHHLQVASYDGTSVLKYQTTADGPVVAAAAPALAMEDSDDYIAYVGTDHVIRFGYSEGCRPACFQYDGTIAGNASTDGVGLTTEGGGLRYAYYDTAGHLNVGLEL